MTYSVLVVDDSSFFRRHLTDIINECPDLQVIGDASNGQEAVEKAASLHPDVITMDFEMPVMNGVVAVQNIMQNSPTPILMLSSLTFGGARITLDALDAGAMDFLPKKFDEIAKHAEGMKKEIHNRILSILKSSKNQPAAPARESSAGASVVVQKDSTRRTASSAETSKRAMADLGKIDCDLVILGASTGGPVAVATVLHKIPENFPVPIIVVQHMPEAFTPEFAKRLDAQLSIKVKHAEEGDRLQAGTVYIAPGGKQLMFSRGSPVRIHIEKGDERINYHPSIDITFASAANIMGDRVLSVVMTGMGNDGCEGARLLKNAGAKVWTQDESSSLIYGMPASVFNAGYSDLVLPLEEMARCLIKVTN